MSKKNILNGESNIETIIFLVLHGIEERRKIIRGFYRYEKIATLLRGIDYIKVNLKRKKYKFNDTSKYEAILAVKELERNNYINVGLHGISPTATGMQRINKILEEKSIYHEEDYCLSSKERAILDSNGIDIGSMNGLSLFLFANILYHVKLWHHVSHKQNMLIDFSLDEKKQLITSLNIYKKEINYYYNYPVEDLISWLLLEDRRLYLKKDVSGKFYYLNFYSPPETWQDLCGVSGIYLIDSRTLKALFFEELIIN